MKIYRNIYFWESQIKQGFGNETIYYSGHIFNNAKFIKDFDSHFDSLQDLKIVCSSCAKQKYREFKKVTK